MGEERGGDGRRWEEMGGEEKRREEKRREEKRGEEMGRVVHSLNRGCDPVPHD